jgi:Papain fold toxin 1, glutamine deamidase
VISTHRQGVRVGDEKDKGQAKPDAKTEPEKEAPKGAAKADEKAKPEPPEIPPWLPLPKDFAEFLECKSDNISLAGDGLKTGVDGVTAGFTEAKQKGHFKITIKGLKDKVPIELPDPLELDASVDKDGKLHIHVRDRKDIPQPIKDGIRDFVNKWNRFVNGKGNKLAPPEAKEGKLVLAKVKTTAALPDGKGFLPHVPTWEKGVAAVAIAGSVAFGVGFMNAGDETKTVSAATGNQAATNGTPNLYKTVTTVRVTPPGRPAADAAATSGNRVETVLPLFVKSPHRVELVNVQGGPVDSFVLPVPNEEGTVKGSTERGGTFDCFVNHRQGVNGSPSSGRCAVQPPSGNAVPATNAGANTEQVARTTETTDGKPWSLLAIPGVLLFAGGGLVLDEERRRADEEGHGGGDDAYEEIGGPDDDGLPPLKLEEVQAQSKAKAEKAKAERDAILRDLLDKIKDVNAGQRNYKYDDGTWITGGNCASCALATDSTLAGDPKYAVPEPLHPYPLEWWVEYALETWGHQPGTYNSIDDVTKVLDIWGDGARGILLMWPREGGGHAINVVNIGGHVLYIDGQTGKEFTNFSSYTKFTLIKTTK